MFVGASRCYIGVPLRLTWYDCFSVLVGYVHLRRTNPPYTARKDNFVVVRFHVMAHRHRSGVASLAECPTIIVERRKGGLVRWVPGHGTKKAGRPIAGSNDKFGFA